MGTPEFAVPSLKILLDNHYSLAAVVTAPDKPRGRGQKLSPSPVTRVALNHHLTILQPTNLKDETFFKQIKDLQPDLIVVVAFRILPKDVFAIPRLGSFNLHASLLPRYRGAAPINWAIIKGEKETGVTTFMLQEKVDTGGILLQVRIPIGAEDDAGSVHDKLAEVGAEIVLHTVRLLEQGKALPKTQDDSQASPAPKITKDDCRIRWDQSAHNIHNIVRGLSPYPAAFTSHVGKVVKIYRTQVLDTASRGIPGTVFAAAEGLHVCTRDVMIAIDELQQEGKKRMAAKEFLRGYRIKDGERFD